MSISAFVAEVYQHQMAMSAKVKAERIAATRDAAIALVEDLEHVREVLKRKLTSRGEIRRLSAVMRRLLVDGDLGRVAAPRIEKLTILAPDRKPYYNVEKSARVLFFASGGAPIFGVNLDAMLLANAGQTPDVQRRIAELTNGIDRQLVPLKPPNFTDQRVLCYHGAWVTRRAAIKHIANVGSGVHSDTPKNEEDQLVAKLRSACTYRVVDGKIEAHVLPELGVDSPRMIMDPHGELPTDYPTDVLDPVLLEVLAAAAMVASAPDVAALEEVVRAE